MGSGNMQRPSRAIKGARRTGTKRQPEPSMDITRLLQRKGARHSSRQEVAATVKRRLAQTPERSYDEVLAGLRTAARRNAAESRRDEPDSNEGGGESAAVDKIAPEHQPPLPVVAAITAEQRVRGGLPIKGDGVLGQMDPTFSFTGVSHAREEAEVHLKATLHCDYHWGVHPTGGGRKDVPSGNADFITIENYERIADALDPDLGPHTNRASLEGYWSRAAVEAHELEHARDDWADWGAQNEGVRVARESFESETIPADDIDGAIDTLLTEGGGGPRHPGKIARAVMAASDEHYGVSLPYMDRPGEIKAHAVGASIERPLAAAVRAHGEQLVQEARAAARAAGRVYTVVAGDTLWRIAERFLGSGKRWRGIHVLNRDEIGSNPDLIHPGQQLLIPIDPASPEPQAKEDWPETAIDDSDRAQQDEDSTVDAIVRLLR